MVRDKIYVPCAIEYKIVPLLLLSILFIYTYYVCNWLILTVLFNYVLSFFTLQSPPNICKSITPVLSRVDSSTKNLISELSSSPSSLTRRICVTLNSSKHQKGLPKLVRSLDSYLRFFFFHQDYRGTGTLFPVVTPFCPLRSSCLCHCFVTYFLNTHGHSTFLIP